MRRLLTPALVTVLVTALAALLLLLPGQTASATSDQSPPYPTLSQSPDGANNWTCRPTTNRPTPVIIVHGTFGDQRSLLDMLSRAMVDRGFCVYSLDYGNRGTGPIEESAKQLREFTRRVLGSTGAAKVSMVGHSQGGMMPRYYIKFLGGSTLVDDLVGLAPSNHGTSITGDPDNPLTGPLLDGFCRACRQQAAGSPFLRRLNAGDETPGRVSYTQLTTRYDEVVVPHTSGYLEPGERTTNLTVQDLCPNDFTDHVFIPMSRTAIAVTLHALIRTGPASPAYRPAC